MQGSGCDVGDAMSGIQCPGLVSPKEGHAVASNLSAATRNWGVPTAHAATAENRSAAPAITFGPPRLRGLPPGLMRPERCPAAPAREWHKPHLFRASMHLPPLWYM